MEIHLRLRDRAAFTRIELLVILAVLALLILLLVPLMNHARQRQLQTQCMNNLRLAGSAYRLWGNSQILAFPMNRPVTNGGSLEYLLKGQVNRYFQIMSNSKGVNPSVLICPADTRIAATNFASLQNSNISYFVGVDADESDPRMFISGDRNWLTNGVAVGSGLGPVRQTDSVGWSSAIHHFRGNIVLSDGSAQSCTSEDLQMLLKDAGTNQQRLAFP